MVHTVIVNGRSYNLPKKNINIASKLDEILKIDSVRGLSIRQKFERLYEFSKDVLGEDVAKEILGTDSLDEIDLSELTIIVRKIVDAYEKPILDYQADCNREKLSRLPLQQLENISKFAESATNMEKLNN